jgi:nucleotide-binding universal stress UspA family protein
MAFKTILCLLEDDRRDDARVAACLALAARTDAHVVGIFAIPPLIVPGDGLAQMPQSLYDNYYAEREAAAEACSRVFLDAARRQAVSAEWRVGRGFARDILREQAFYSDLVVLGAPPTRASVLDDNSGLPADIAIRSGRPVLYLPPQGSFLLEGRRVMIAWKPGREAARALTDALPFLQGADTVHVITGDLPSQAPAMDISVVLARHGVRVEMQNIHAPADRSLGEQLLNEADRRQCDLLIMGIYGHSRMNEWVFGGVSQHILRGATLPILFSH